MILSSFALNIILYKKLDSKYLTNLNGSLNNGGSYWAVWRWLTNYSEANPAKLVSTEDTVFGTDNERRLGKTYTNSIGSNLTASVISVIVAFILNFRLYYQYLAEGVTSRWRFGEKEYNDQQKKEILEKALEGREKGS